MVGRKKPPYEVMTDQKTTLPEIATNKATLVLALAKLRDCAAFENASALKPNQNLYLTHGEGEEKIRVPVKVTAVEDGQVHFTLAQPPGLRENTDAARGKLNAFTQELQHTLALLEDDIDRANTHLRFYFYRQRPPKKLPEPIREADMLETKLWADSADPSLAEALKEIRNDYKAPEIIRKMRDAETQLTQGYLGKPSTPSLHDTGSTNQRVLQMSECPHLRVNLGAGILTAMGHMQRKVVPGQVTLPTLSSRRKNNPTSLAIITARDSKHPQDKHMLEIPVILYIEEDEPHSPQRTFTFLLSDLDKPAFAQKYGFKDSAEFARIHGYIDTDAMRKNLEKYGEKTLFHSYAMRLAMPEELPFEPKEAVEVMRGLLQRAYTPFHEKPNTQSVQRAHEIHDTADKTSRHLAEKLITPFKALRANGNGASANGIWTARNGTRSVASGMAASRVFEEYRAYLTSQGHTDLPPSEAKHAAWANEDLKQRDSAQREV